MKIFFSYPKISNFNNQMKSLSNLKHVSIKCKKFPDSIRVFSACSETDMSGQVKVHTSGPITNPPLLSVLH